VLGQLLFPNIDKALARGCALYFNEDPEHDAVAMTMLYTHPRFLDHDTGQHPECAQRLHSVIGHLETTGLLDQIGRPTWQPATDEQLFRVHDPDNIDALEHLANKGGGRADADTVVSPASVDVARLAAGALCDAVDQVLEGPKRQALCLVRPPGHHALAERAMGFCLLNNIAIAAKTALAKGLKRILIVDWDVHHGNGTQACFYEDPRVGFFSVHRWPFYPGTGAADETGSGDGLGATRNLPVTWGTSRVDYRSLVMRELEDFAARIKPELVLVSAGFDSHREDPIGSLGLEIEDFVWLTDAVKQIANSYAHGRLVSTLEGGYNPPVLAQCVEAHLQILVSDRQTAHE